MSNEVIKIGLIGCGRISKNHFSVIDAHPQLQLTAVCDIDESRAKELGETYNVPYFTNEDEFFNQDFSLVSICTPSGLHPQHGIKAAQKGINILTEKPMAVRVFDAVELIKTAKDCGVRLFVVKQNRLNPGIVLLKNAIEKGRFGKIYMISSNIFWTRPQEYYDMADWRGTWALDGGAYMNQASHYVDLVQWLGGPIESVFAKTKTVARNIEAEDTGVTVINFENGAMGCMQVTMCTYPKNLEGSITILGEKGSVKIGGTSVNKVETWNFDTYDDDDALIEQATTNPPNVYGFGHQGYYDNVVKSLLGQESAKTSGVEGLQSLRLLEAIYQSSKLEKEIFLKDIKNC